MNSKIFWASLCIFYYLHLSLCSAEPRDVKLSEEDLQTLLEKFMKKVNEILHGNDPYNYAGSSGHSNSYGTYYNGSVSELIISGISSMNVTYLNATQVDPNIYLGLDLSFSNIMVTGNYFLDLDTLSLLKLYGAGELGVIASSLGINVTASVTQEAANNNVLQFTDLDINLGLPELKLDVKNLLNRPALSTYASQILTDISPKLLSEDGKLQTMLSSWAKSNLNDQAVKNEITLAFVIEFMQKFTQ
uniref:Replication-associated protein n=1 Tax=Lygus hesperus TaxID=30085 RepID=A0A0A9X4R5_LYGHE